MGISTNDWSTPTHFFGYGSLMYPCGINGRGMSYEYDWGDLTPVVLCGYKRGLYAYYMYCYYGIMPSEKDSINGVVFEIKSEHDFEALLHDEGVSKPFKYTKDGAMYEVKDVTKNLGLPYAKVFTLVSTEDKSNNGKALSSYLNHVYQNITPWGSHFIDDFLNSGGKKPKHPYTLPIYGLVRKLKQYRRR